MESDRNDPQHDEEAVSRVSVTSNKGATKTKSSKGKHKPSLQRRAPSSSTLLPKTDAQHHEMEQIPEMGGRMLLASGRKRESNNTNEPDDVLPKRSLTSDEVERKPFETQSHSTQDVVTFNAIYTTSDSSPDSCNENHEMVGKMKETNLKPSRQKKNYASSTSTTKPITGAITKLIDHMKQDTSPSPETDD